MDGNSSKETGSNMNYLQKEQLVQFAEENFSGLFETVSDDPEHMRLWSLITQILNELGPVKNLQGWKRCFTCLKSTAKAKLFKVNAKQCTNQRLNETEKRIVKMFKMDHSNRLQPEKNQIAPSNVSSSFSESEVNVLHNCSSVIDGAHSDEILTIAPQALQRQNTGMAFSNHNGTQFIPQSHNEHEHENSGLTMFCESSNLDWTSNQQQEVSIQLQTASISTPLQMEVIQQPQNKRSYSNAAQKQKLATLVKENYSALFGRVSNRLHADLLKAKIWKLITAQLNSIGPAKTVEGWKRCLNTLKDLTKKKKTANRQGKTNVQLTAIEKEIDKTFKTLDGSEKLHELGLKQRVKRASVPGEASSSNSNCLSQQGARVTATATVTSAKTSNQMTSSHLNSVSENISNQVDPQLQSQNEVPACIVLPEIGIGAIAESDMPEFNEMELYNSVILPEETTSTVQHSQRGRVIATVTSPITSNEMTSSDLHSVSENTSNQVDPQLQSPNEVQHCIVLPELGIGAIADIDMPEFNEMIDSSMILSEETTSTVQPSQREGIAIIISNQQIVPPLADRLQDQADNVHLDTEEIRPLEEERPQRRGVEINLNRYIQPYRQINSDDDDDLIMPTRGRSSRGRVRRVRDPRRVRLTVPLGVMAAQSLQLQRRTNALLSELLFEIRDAANRR